MSKKIKLIKNKEDLYALKNTDIDVIFLEIQKDTIGQSASNPTWGEVFEINNGELKSKGIGLYKEFDYDLPDAAFAEKVASILGKNILKDIRFPEIDIVEKRKGYPGLISYRLLDNDTEDLMHLEDILFHKFEREDFEKKRCVFSITDILECLKIQIPDSEKYKLIEKNVIQTLLFDAVTNNVDRHPNNWALIWDKNTKQYEFANYDHANAFIDMFESKSFFTVRGWVNSYITINPDERKTEKRALGKDIIKYIFENHKEYFDDFYQKFNANLENSLQEIEQIGLGNLKTSRLKVKLNEKKSYMKNLYREKGELEYE